MGTHKGGTYIHTAFICCGSRHEGTWGTREEAPARRWRCGPGGSDGAPRATRRRGPKEMEDRPEGHAATCTERKNLGHRDEEGRPTGGTPSCCCSAHSDPPITQDAAAGPPKNAARRSVSPPLPARDHHHRHVLRGKRGQRGVQSALCPHTRGLEHANESHAGARVGPSQAQAGIVTPCNACSRAPRAGRGARGQKEELTVRTWVMSQ